jgi:hypothetical protein
MMNDMFVSIGLSTRCGGSHYFGISHYKELFGILQSVGYLTNVILPEPKMRKYDFKICDYDLLVLHVIVHAIDFLLSKVMF